LWKWTLLLINELHEYDEVKHDEFELDELDDSDEVELDEVEVAEVVLSLMPSSTYSSNVNPPALKAQTEWVG